MAEIIKASSGLLFKEEFKGNISLLWDLNPNFPDRVAQNGDSISLLPGAKRVELLVPIPLQSGYVMQSRITYHPTQEVEKAGITFKSVTDSQIDLEICGDDALTCTNAKLTVDEYGILSARTTKNGHDWNYHGNTKLTNMNHLGFYIAENTMNDEFMIHDCIMYKTNFVTINNFDRTTYIKLFDSAGNEITDSFIIKKYNSKLVIDCTDMIFPLNDITINVYDRTTDDLIHQGVLNDIYGGDTYEYNYNVDFYINDTLLNSFDYDLGGISGEKIFELKIVNKEQYELTDRKISVTYASLLNSGHKAVDIAEENSDDFYDSITTTFAPGETKKFKIRVIKNKTYMQVDGDYKFNILFE